MFVIYEVCRIMTFVAYRVCRSINLLAIVCYYGESILSECVCGDLLHGHYTV